MTTKQVVLITGASTGIGRALALELAPRRIALVLLARRRALLDGLAATVEQQGSEALAVACDVSDRAQVKHAIATARQRFGRIDWAILSAGISQPTLAENFQAAEFERLLRTNLLGVAYCLEELIPLLRAQGGGKIAALSSLAGERGIPGSAGYCATKAALNTLFDGLRVPLKPHGVELVTIAPGYVLTPMTEKFGRMPFVISAEEAARVIIRGLEQNKRAIRFPFVPALLMWVMRVLPVSLFDAITSKRRVVRLDTK